MAILAAVGTGRFKDVRQACQSVISIARTIKPQAAAKKLYARNYQQYRALYPALKGEFKNIAAM